VSIFRLKPHHIETGRADKVVHFPVQVATSRNMAPNGGESVLPALDSRPGRKPMLHLIVPHDGQQTAVQDDKLLA